MTGIASTMALLLAALFVYAAVGKLLAPRATARDFDALGVPIAFISARLVPIGELVVALTLVATPRVGSVLATLTLAGFTGVIVRAVATGRNVSFGCLGSLWNQGSRQLGSGQAGDPVSAETIVRNLVLVGMAITAGMTSSVVVPDLASIAASTTALGAAALAGQLWAHRRATGRLWSVQLAGEANVDLDSGVA